MLPSSSNPAVKSKVPLCFMIKIQFYYIILLPSKKASPIQKTQIKTNQSRNRSAHQENSCCIELLQFLIRPFGFLIVYIKMDLSVDAVREKTRSAIDIVFEDLCYEVEVEDKTSKTILPCKNKASKQILRGVSGIFKSGEISAIMGASGAGKTTLLNMLACRMKKPESSKIYANSTEYDYENFGNFANYVMQTDVLMQTMTVRETLQFAANLKLNLGSKAKEEKVTALVNRLKLEKCLDVLVGGPLIKGISGGEKKRTSIAFELISQPEVIFLDEPTSGLDSLTSYIIVSYLRDLAHIHGKTVIMTIHQPNTDIFLIFDRLLLMVEGQIIYQGAANAAVSYFGDNFGLRCPEFHNPPDFFMSIMHPETPENLARYPVYQQTYQRQLKGKVEKEMAKKETMEIRKRKEEVSMATTYSTLLKRDFKNTARNPMLLQARLMQTIFLTLFVGGMFYNATNGGDYVTLTNWRTLMGFLFFFSINIFMASLAPVALVFPLERRVFLKEEGSRLYSVYAYFLSRNLVEIPNIILFPLLTAVMLYWFVGLASTATQFFTFYLILFFLSFAGDSIGLLVGSLVDDSKTVSVVLNFFISPLIVFSGFYVNSKNLPDWIGWLQYISPLKYAFTAMSYNEVQYAAHSNISMMNFDVKQWESTFILLGLAVFFRLLSLFFLWALRNRVQ